MFADFLEFSHNLTLLLVIAVVLLGGIFHQINGLLRYMGDIADGLQDRD